MNGAPIGQGGSAPLVYIIAGEPSGDALGGRLMAALRERSAEPVRFAGIGGERMAEQGLHSLVPLHELAIMGVAEVLPRARRILRRVAETVAEIQRLRPAAVVTIDSSGFTWRVAQRLRRQGERLPLIHYVAPMVWAWRGGRARRMARWYDHLLVLLPFEPPYFTRVGLACTYVGHPVVESGADRGDGVAFRQRHGIPSAAPLLTVLPGSRRGEVTRLLPPFAGTVAELAKRHSDLHVVVPTTATVAESVSAAVRGWPVPTIVVRGEREKYDAFAASDAALAASGTVALELAMARLPAVVAYRVSPLTGWLVQRMVKIKYMHLLNLILDRAVVPELRQQDVNVARLTMEVDRLLTDPAAREAQVAQCGEALQRLGLGELSPSRRAADEVLAIIARYSPDRHEPAARPETKRRTR
jgi:lipid-A-disaccharide synthase